MTICKYECYVHDVGQIELHAEVYDAENTAFTLTLNDEPIGSAFMDEDENATIYAGLGRYGHASQEVGVPIFDY